MEVLPFLGPPGSGKGTYARLLVAAMNAGAYAGSAAYVEVGSALRSRFGDAAGGDRVVASASTTGRGGAGA
ncbi:MAG: hypothetical protein VX181_19585, partial [Pseudomonadota bacterium]|nr:hypothetical protein [Pseudomonadota bacterium]